MKKNILKALAVFIVAVLLIGGFLLFSPISNKAALHHNSKNGNGGFSLIKPAFLNEAIAADSDGTNFLEQEAGMSIYTNTNHTIDINKVSSAFKTIEY